MTENTENLDVAGFYDIRGNNSLAKPTMTYGSQHLRVCTRSPHQYVEKWLSDFAKSRAEHLFSGKIEKGGGGRQTGGLVLRHR